MTDGACAPTSPPPANLQRLSRLFLSRDERGALDHCAQCSEVVTFAQTVDNLTKSPYQQRFSFTSALVCVASGSGIEWRCVCVRDAG
jgi:hypothetical protein